MPQDLMAGPPPTHLPADPAASELADADRPEEVIRRHPSSPWAWAAFADQARSSGADEVAVYAYARVGYHRGLDLLRRHGWKGWGPVPWEHEPNRGFLRCLGLLALTARAIGETDEWDRCSRPGTTPSSVDGEGRRQPTVWPVERRSWQAWTTRAAMPASAALPQERGS
jgi:hypothetical protein